MAWPILTILVFQPLVGALSLFLVRGEADLVATNAKAVGLWSTGISLGLSCFLWLQFDENVGDFQFMEQREWIPSLGISYSMGIDGISIIFIILTSFLTFICVLASWEAITNRVREYMIAFLLMESMMLGAFCALDTVLFYVFFEGLLIPMFIIIGIWGGPGRVHATLKFFLYTLAGSVFFLVAILVIYLKTGTTYIPSLMDSSLPFDVQLWLWLLMFASFAVKIPMWPFHTWLPDAHVEAPTAGSVILAGVLLKLGGYGFIRFSLPMLPDATSYFTPLIFVLSIIAIIYTSLVALVQKDMKKLIAYSSVAHMGFVTIGLFSLTTQGVEGALIIMLSHGLVSAALFLSVGVLYDRIHSRLIDDYGGLVHSMPFYSFSFMVFTLAAIGLPGTSGFVGEILVLMGIFSVSTWTALFASLGVLLGAAYMLWLYKRIIFGELRNERVKLILDLNVREKCIFIPIIFGVLFIGIYPSPLLNTMHLSVERLIVLSQPNVTEQRFQE